MEKPKYLDQTLQSEELKKDFRSFLRNKLDNNQDQDLNKKRKFEQWLDFIMTCETVFKLPNSESWKKPLLVDQIRKKFFSVETGCHNIAVNGQRNRRTIQNFHKSINGLEACVVSLKKSYDYIYCKLEQKHHIFVKVYLSSQTKIFSLKLAKKWDLC